MSTLEPEYTKESLVQGIRKLRSREALGALFLVVKYFPQIKPILENAGPETSWMDYLARTMGQMASINGEEFTNDFLKLAGVLLIIPVAQLDNYAFTDILAAMGDAWKLNGMTEQVGSMIGMEMGSSPEEIASSEIEPNQSELPLEFPNLRELIK